MGGERYDDPPTLLGRRASCKCTSRRESRVELTEEEEEVLRTELWELFRSP